MEGPLSDQAPIPIQRMQQSGPAPQTQQRQTWGQYLWSFLPFTSTGATETTNPPAQQEVPSSTSSNGGETDPLSQPLPPPPVRKANKKKTKRKKPGGAQATQEAPVENAQEELEEPVQSTQPAAEPSETNAPVPEPVDRDEELARIQAQAQEVLDFLNSAPEKVKQTDEWQAAVRKITSIISKAPDLITKAEESIVAGNIAKLGVGIERTKTLPGYQATEAAELSEEQARLAQEEREEHERRFNELADRVIQDIERIHLHGNRGINLVDSPEGTRANADALYDALYDKYHNKPARWAGSKVKYYIVRGPQTKIDITGHVWKDGKDKSRENHTNVFNYHVNW